MSKEKILNRYRANVREKFDMPDLSDLHAITYADPLQQFIQSLVSLIDTTTVWFGNAD